MVVYFSFFSAFLDWFSSSLIDLIEFLEIGRGSVPPVCFIALVLSCALEVTRFFTIENFPSEMSKSLLIRALFTSFSSLYFSSNLKLFAFCFWEIALFSRFLIYFVGFIKSIDGLIFFILSIWCWYSHSPILSEYMFFKIYFGAYISYL